MTIAHLLALPLAASAQTKGEVKLSLEEWLRLEAEIAALRSATPAPRPFVYQRRSIQARFDRGVLDGALSFDVEVHAPSVRVPLVAVDASLSSVRVDGKKAVAVKDGAHYAVVVEGIGVHRVDVAFAVGEERARFARAFSVLLPRAPISQITVDLPEKELDVVLDGGVILGRTEKRGRTIVEGAIDARDRLSVTWRRRLAHEGGRDREMEVRALALVGIEDEVLRSRTRLEYRLISGETDRVELALPDGLEVTGVRGDAILQWFTEPNKLVVLLKHLVTDELKMLVDAQSPLGDRKHAALSFVRPSDASLREVIVAVEGRAGFAIEVAKFEGGETVGIREVPATLRDLTNKPILFAHKATKAWPTLQLAIERNAEIALTQAVIDDLQASTVVTEQGVEVTKLRLYVRNNTRQYLTMMLPAGASITHALIDGVPFHPALASEQSQTQILIPLRQSERLVDGQQQHVVRSGETLGEISLRYLGGSAQWQTILDANPHLSGPQDLSVGDTLSIPSDAGAKFEESNFVVEIAYKQQSGTLGRFGRRSVDLPKLDIPVMAATWHLYFPEALEPLAFSSNLQQLTSIRYDPLRRLRWFWEKALWVESAWASSGPADESYDNILEIRKRIYKDEQKKQVTEALAAFPLVGQRYRFERVLLGSEQATMQLTYLERSSLPLVRLGALLLALLFTFRWVSVARARGLRGALATDAMPLAVVGGLALLFLGHHVLGVHRFTLYGIDAGLALAVLPPILSGRWDRMKTALGQPLVFERVWRGRTLLQLFVGGLVLTAALSYPLLLSLMALVVLVVIAIRTKEVAHA